MADISADLLSEYRGRCEASCASSKTPPDLQTATNWHWLWLLKERYEKLGELAYFGALMHRPREAAMRAILDYVARKSDAPAFLAAIRKEAGGLYAETLRTSGVVADIPQKEYGAIVDEVDLELLKACTPLVGRDIALKETCDAIAAAGSTMWFRYIDQFHALVGLPNVRKLAPHVVLLSRVENEVLKGGRFDQYAIGDDAERDRLREASGR